MSIMGKNKAEHCIYPGSFSVCAAINVLPVYLLSELNSHSLISSQTPKASLASNNINCHSSLHLFYSYIQFLVTWGK